MPRASFCYGKTEGVYNWTAESEVKVGPLTGISHPRARSAQLR